jgi:phosphoribosylformylglycinamidine cyclo-ligase
MSITYAAAGVNIEAGDNASKNAYTHAKSTFASRQGRIGEPVVQDGGFAGLLNMGDFFMTQCCDTVGTKITIAEKTKNFAGLGHDLLCMVCDDAVCNGAEVVSITNTFETNQIVPAEIDAMMASLAAICREQKIVITGGEVAEVGAMTNGTSWGADAVGVVKPHKVISGKNIAPGHIIIGLKGRVLRCNGLSLARKICQLSFGDNWMQTEWKDGQTWGEVLLTPSKVFHRTLLNSVLGNFDEDALFVVHGIAHITGGGIPGNIPRLFHNDTFGADIHDWHAPHDAIKELVNLGNVDEKEAYKTWNCGTAMVVVVDKNEAQNICNALNQEDAEVQAKIVGKITDSGTIVVQSKFSDQTLIWKTKDL